MQVRPQSRGGGCGKKHQCVTLARFRQTRWMPATNRLRDVTQLRICPRRMSPNLLRCVSLVMALNVTCRNAAIR